jgi:hypothetical protein
VRAAVGILVLLVSLAGCDTAEDGCTGVGTFVLRNDTAQDLRARTPFAASDSVFVVPTDSSIVLGSFQGDFPDSYPDPRELMGCLSLSPADADSVVFRLGPSAAPRDWVFEETAECRATFTLTVADSMLGTDAGADDCPDPFARAWSTGP